VTPSARRLRIGVIGGSIAGCATAISAIRCGHEVKVLERSTGYLGTRGQGLVQPIELVERLMQEGYVDEEMPVLRISRRRWLVRDGDRPEGRLVLDQPFRVAQVNWGVLFANLRERVPDWAYRSGANVVGIEDLGKEVTLHLADGQSLDFDVVFAADGNLSTARRLLFPDEERTDSGHVVWRGWFDEAGSTLDDVSLVAEMNTVGFPCGHANVWLLPSAAGTEPGKRELAWNLYGGGNPPELVADGGVVRAVPPGGCTDAQLHHLRRLVRRHFPPAYASVVEATETPIITPIYDVRVPTLVRGRVALVGDAGAVLRPVTGSGATKGLEDALAIASAFSSGSSVADALAAYDAERWPEADRLVRLGQRMGRALVTDAPAWHDLVGHQLQALIERTLDGSGWYALTAPEAQ
jgi:2-polyprenyl-6-methoxyphenol hydroxylase-like FAD-dependent oxidoreductase